ncbi:hypothetical protein AHAS_Ahas17G0152300 [Arachis hypogaea]
MHSFRMSRGWENPRFIPRTVANRKWRSVIEAFQMYIMSNFVVLKNTTKTKTYPSKWLLMFSHRTRVNHVKNPSFPLEAFHFKTIPQLVTVQKINENDIVGTTVFTAFYSVKWLLSGAPSNSMSISQRSSQGASSGIDELTVGSAIVKSIDEVLTSIKEDWFYKSCRKCPKKVETPIGDRYECTKCGHTHGCAVLRWRLYFMMEQSINLLLWHRETYQLCEKQAKKVKEKEVITGGNEYPATLDNIMDKRVLFKINVKVANINHYDQVFTVMKICDDDEIIEKNIPVIDTTNPTNNVEDNECSNSLSFLGNVVNLNTDNDTQYTMDGMEECISNLKYKTPAKRACSRMKPASNGLNHIENEGQLSTNKFSRKGSKKKKSLMNELDN